MNDIKELLKKDYWDETFIYKWPHYDSPSLITIKLAMASGTLAPAAMNVIPIRVSGIPNVKPGPQRDNHNRIVANTV